MGNRRAIFGQLWPLCVVIMGFYCAVIGQMNCCYAQFRPRNSDSLR